MKRLKVILNARGENLDVNDDNFDKNTLDAVTKFQSDNGKTANGIVGPETRKILGL